jgi:hypothetical protein
VGVEKNLRDWAVKRGTCFAIYSEANGNIQSLASPVLNFNEVPQRHDQQRELFWEMELLG